jgi:casein kinase I family protein HRR25
MQQKLRTPVDDLCSGLPHEFQVFLHYAQQLPFDVEPDYHYICSLFQNLFVTCGYLDDGVFDWSGLSGEI